MVYLVSKKEYEHGEDDINFKYKYVIRVMDIANLRGDEEAPIAIELILVPSPESLCGEERESVIESMGHEDIDYYGVSEYGISARMANEYLEGIEDDKYSLDDIKAIREGLGAITATYESMNSLRGFHLDKPWNVIGTNGWDTLRNAVLGERLFKF